MNRKTELLLLSLHFFLEWKGDKKVDDSTLKEYHKFLNTVCNRLCRTEDEIKAYIGKAYDKLSIITEHEDVTANALILSTGFLSLALEEDYLKGSQAMTAKRIGNDIYTKVEDNLNDKDMIRISNKLIAEYQDKAD